MLSFRVQVEDTARAYSLRLDMWNIILPWFNYTGFKVIFPASKPPDLDGQIEGYPRLNCVRDLNNKGGQRTDGAINRLVINIIGRSEVPLSGKKFHDTASWNVTSFFLGIVYVGFRATFLV